MENNPLIIVFTYAYNARYTIRRALDSVLNQTYKNWVYYCVDNGSTDDTGDIIAQYAAKDARIIKLRNRQNHIWEEGNGHVQLCEKHGEDAYFCWLDADDEYTPEAFADMLEYARRFTLDIVACGSYFIDAKTRRVKGERVFKKSGIVAGKGFSAGFILYQPFMRTVWGKLYRVPVILNSDFSRIPRLIYGGDTLLAMEAFRQAGSVGILCESYHKYYVSGKSTSYKWDPERTEADNTLLELTRRYLLDKCGEVTPDNEEHMLLVYCNALVDTLEVLIDADMKKQDQLCALLDMFKRDGVKALASYEPYNPCEGARERRQELFKTAAIWLSSFEEVPDEKIETYCAVGELVSAAGEHADGWIFFKKLRVRFLMESGRKEEAQPLIEELSELFQ